MRKNAMLGGACLVIVFAWGFATRVAAQTNDHRTFFTFSGPVELPGVALAPGKYLFRNPDTLGGRTVVQVLSADGKKPYGMFFSRTVERSDPPRDPEIWFMEAAADAPPPIKTIWYPGERTGLELVYPKEQARRLAMKASEPVLTTDAQTTTTAQTNATDLSQVSSGGQETLVVAEHLVPLSVLAGTLQRGEVAPASIEIAAVVIPLPRPSVHGVQAVQQTARANPPAAGASSAQQQPRTRLPRTGTRTPLVGLFGMGLLIVAVAMRFWRTVSL